MLCNEKPKTAANPKVHLRTHIDTEATLIKCEVYNNQDFENQYALGNYMRVHAKDNCRILQYYSILDVIQGLIYR